MLPQPRGRGNAAGMRLNLITGQRFPSGPGHLGACPHAGAERKGRLGFPDRYPPRAHTKQYS